MTDIMRQQYRALNDEERAAMSEVKADAAALYDKLSSFGTSRELSVAKTKLEELVMWTTKHITGAGVGGATTNSGGHTPRPNEA